MFKITPALKKITDSIIAAGGHPFVVGGAVRDFVLGLEPKDIDIEVYGLPIDDLIAAMPFKLDIVGKAFGVIKVTLEGEDFDVALPRSENKEGSGHRGFIVKSDHNMSTSDACQRRDFTMNALMFDLISNEIIDDVGGLTDIDNKIIRAVSPAFAEDPLRVLRACQFAARFQFTIETSTIEMCKTLIPEMKTLPIERLWNEWCKLLLKSSKPSVGLEAMRETGALTLFPELEALIDVPQHPVHHPEGSVWIHNNMVIDCAAIVCKEDELNEEESLITMLGALCHDLGKPSTTEYKANASGEMAYRAHAHEAAGKEPTISFLTSIGCPPAIIDAVVPIVENHLAPFQLYREKASPAAIRRLAMKVPITRLCRVARADHWGRTTPEALALTDSRTIPEIVWMFERAKEVKVESGKPTPILMGRHLLERGFKQGPQMGTVLKAAFEAQLDGTFEDIDSAQAWLDNYLKE